MPEPTLQPVSERRLHVTTIVVGSFAENTYVIAPAGTSECAVIDPGGDGRRVVHAIQAADLDVRYVLTTHGHADHTGAAAAIKRELGGTYVAHEADVALISNPDPWIIGLLGDFEMPPEVDLKVRGGETLPIGDLNVSIIATPGHTPGSICYRCDFAVFTGDTLFRGSIGRYDLPGGNGVQELSSIRDGLLTLPDDTQVFPGHGPCTSIETERLTNPFLRLSP